MPKKPSKELASTSIRIYPSTLKVIQYLTFKKGISAAEIVQELLLKHSALTKEIK